MIKTIGNNCSFLDVLGKMIYVITYRSRSQRVVPRSAPSASTGNLLEMHILGPHPGLIKTQPSVV